MTATRAPLAVLYVFRERKQPLLDAWHAGTQPDTLLFGFNHMAGQGVHSEMHEPDYSRAGRAVARQVGRLGPDFLQLRTLPHLARFDVVFLTAGWPLLLARRLLRRPPRMIWLNLTLTVLLAPPRGASPGARLRARLMRKAVAGADRVVCVARSQRDWLQRALNMAPSHLPVVPSGVDAAFYTPGDAALDDGAEVLAAGRDPGRDYATFIAAMDTVPRRAHIVASPRNLAGVTVPPNVRVSHNLPQAALRDAYRAAPCVVVPTHGDGYPLGSDCSGTLVLLDALACGRPAVVTDRASIRTYVSPGQEAMTVPASDAPALGEAIRALLDDSHAALELARRGRTAIEERLNTRSMAAQLADVFRETAS